MGMQLFLEKESQLIGWRILFLRESLISGSIPLGPGGRLTVQFSTKCFLSASRKSMTDWLKPIVAGALFWIAIILVALAYQPARVGSVIATLEIGFSLIVAILACVVLRRS
jgi:hypothetical protein